MTDERGKDVYGLIRGAFTTDDARELLMTLLDNKIGFHQLNNRSRRERFGESDAAVVKRVDELRQTKADIASRWYYNSRSHSHRLEPIRCQQQAAGDN